MYGPEDPIIDDLLKDMTTLKIVHAGNYSCFFPPPIHILI